MSLKLTEVSLESIVWILKSIAIDKMKPSVSLINSRLKECFALNIRKEWKIFIDNLLKSQKLKKKMNRERNKLGYLTIYEEENSSILINDKIPQDYEDLLKIDDNDPNFKEFLNFIDKFFESKKISSPEKVSPKKWVSSVENSQFRNNTAFTEI